MSRHFHCGRCGILSPALADDRPANRQDLYLFGWGTDPQVTQMDVDYPRNNLVCPTCQHGRPNRRIELVERLGEP